MPTAPGWCPAANASVGRTSRTIASSGTESTRSSGGCAPSELAAVQLDDPLHVRRPRRLRAEPRGEEVGELALQRRVEAALEADRRRRLRAHRGAAERARRRGRGRPRRRRRARRAGAGSGRGPPRLPAPRPRDPGRPASPTKSESPVRTSHGSSPRERSITAKQQCSGRWPGVWIVRRTTSPTSISVPSSSGSCGKVASASRCTRIGMPCSSARRPWPGDVVGVRVRLEDADEPDARGAPPPPAPARSRTAGRRRPRRPPARRRRGSRRSPDRRSGTA